MSDDPTADAPAFPPARIEVVGGGAPSAAELAALAVALTPVGAPDADPAHTDDGAPAWARAALLEGVGHRRPTRPSDLAAATRLG